MILYFEQLEYLLCELERHHDVKDGLVIEVCVGDTRYRLTRHSIDPKEMPSPRQLQVLQCIAAGYSNNQIVVTLGMADGTIDTHVDRMFEKLQSVSRPHLIARAYEKGLLPSPSFDLH
ncbi:MAG TPA: helix-turn-helix transcriptional regulator [Phototrophicaceae bacterium]|jgi:DNA-binding NarL/FixJ family response regulator|nr:helix-turn-helix transcriptional regulator [Phototrophicaceae bacterium]